MKKFVIISLITLLSFIANFLVNMLFDKMDYSSNLIDSSTFGIVVMVILIFFYSELFEPGRGQNKEFWKAIREAIKKK